MPGAGLVVDSFGSLPLAAVLPAEASGGVPLLVDVSDALGALVFFVGIVFAAGLALFTGLAVGFTPVAAPGNVVVF